MSAIPPSFVSGEPAGSCGAVEDLSDAKWAALHAAANVVASLAGLEPEPIPSRVRDYPALIGVAEPWRRELAARGIDEMAAMMEPGLEALLGVNARGADPRAAALALWQEFEQARASLLTLLPTSGRVA
ncbi:MAG TPA: hypothetical protein VL331_00520 [Croceibacterium sp.]|nr:hypothetical protein [Croceibacterium sp.]